MQKVSGKKRYFFGNGLKQTNKFYNQYVKVITNIINNNENNNDNKIMI